jgi:hypothetical protein
VEEVMLNAFTAWLTENWDLIVEIFMWAMSIFMIFILVVKIHKIIKFNFEALDVLSLFFGAAWILAIVIFGFDHIRQYFLSFL